MAKNEKFFSLANSRFWLSIIIITPAFALITAMLIMHNMTLISDTSTINDILKDTKLSNAEKSELISTLTESFEKNNQSNLTIFNTFIPVFAAWVGTVVAFYFSSEQSSKSQQNSLEREIALIQKISDPSIPDMTIDELLKNYPTSTDIKTCNLTDTIANISKSIETFNNLVVIVGNEPKGILYKSDFGDVVSPEYLASNSKSTLGDIIETIKDNTVTEEMWSKEGVANFAKLALTDKVSEVIEKMNKIRKSDPDVRGIVFENEKMYAIVNHNMLTDPLSK